jgi:hypothetical protein
MAEGSNYDYLFKVSLPPLIWLPRHAGLFIDPAQVVLIGDSGVGKS